MTHQIHARLDTFLKIIMVMMVAAGSLTPVVAQDATPIVTDPDPVETPATVEPGKPDSQVSTPTTENFPEIADDNVGTPEPGVTRQTTTQLSSSLSIEPVVAVSGSVIYLENTTPDTCVDFNGWTFSIANSDPSITSMSVQFSNGDTISTSLWSNSSANVTSHTQYMVVNAWAYSDTADSPAVIHLDSGPCNDPIDPDATYSATFDLWAIGFTPGTGYWDGMLWTFTDKASGDIVNGTMSGSDEFTIPDLANGDYHIFFHDPSGRYQDRELDFTIIDQSTTMSIGMVRSNASQRVDYYVKDTTLSWGISGVTIRIHDDRGYDETRITDISGYASFGFVPLGGYEITMSKEGYVSTYQIYYFNTTTPLTMNTFLREYEDRTLSGMVGDVFTNESIPGAKVTLRPYDPYADSYSTTTDADGAYSMAVYNSSWTIEVSAPGYHSQIASPVFTYSGDFTYIVMLEQISPVPISLEVSTNDAGSPAGATWSLLQGSTEVGTGTLDVTGIVSLGDLPIGETYTVSISGQSAGYQDVTESFTVTTGVGTWAMTLQPIPTQAITLDVSTSDADSPAGATYTVLQGTNEVDTGTLDASGTVSLGGLPIGETYTVSISGQAAGYQDATESFTVTTGVGTWAMTLQPIPTQTITLRVTTSDGSSPEGASFTAQEMPMAVSGLSLNASSPGLMQVGPDPITGTISANGTADVSDLPIGTTYIVTIDGDGYENYSGQFLVEAGVGSWSIELHAIQVPITPSPTVEPTQVPTEAPTATLTPTEPAATPTEVITPTSPPATPSPTEASSWATPATTPVSEADSAPQVTGLPATGSGANELRSRLLGASAIALVAILIALWTRKAEADH